MVGCSVSPGEAEIRHGDARELGLGDGCVDLAVTSPPYNLNVEYDTHDDDLSPEEFRSLLVEAFTECYRVLADDGRLATVVGLGVGQPMNNIPRVVEECATEAGFELRDIHVWNKGESESSSAWGSWRSASNPRQIINHEMIHVFYKNQPGRETVRQETMTKEEFMTFTKSVWDVKPSGRADHPAPFPPEIPYRLMKLHSYEGDVVLDPFAGTGTTCAVARDLGRAAVGVDVSERYVEIARERCREGVATADLGVVSDQQTLSAWGVSP